jgi:hypothetical protein
MWSFRVGTSSSRADGKRRICSRHWSRQGILLPGNEIGQRVDVVSDHLNPRCSSSARRTEGNSYRVTTRTGAHGLDQRDLPTHPRGAQLLGCAQITAPAAANARRPWRCTSL